MQPVLIALATLIVASPFFALAAWVAGAVALQLSSL